ncbi:MAG: hypothetical protein AB8B99_16815 [Phormidesmis sp.]
MRLEFKGFHPKDAQNAVLMVLTDTGVEYTNTDTRAFQFIPYEQVAGFSGWIPVYGSIHVYSSNANLTIHVNFSPEVAAAYLDEIQTVLKEKTQKVDTRQLASAVS